MAHSLSAKKRIRQNEKLRAHNRWRLRALRAALKDFNQKISQGTLEEAKQAYQTCQRVLDRTAQQRIIHKNHASRRKSRLAARLKARQAAG